MPQSRRQVADSALEAERQSSYQGTARINLDILRFGRDQPEELDRDHVEHLKKCFRNEGCQRLPARNHVPVLISQQQLADATRDSGVSTQQLFAGQRNGYPSLEFPTGVQLQCLHGRHRIEAGREFLLPTEKWWIVDLYLPDLDPNLGSWLVEEYSHEQRPSDGEIYQKLRQYDTEKNLSSKLRWKSRLRGIRAKSLNTLYKHEDLTDAFDALLAIPGLWHGMKLSTIHKLFPLRCNEEIVHYLRHIKSVWSGLVQGNREAMSRIDTTTVQALEMRAPQASTLDAKMLRSQLRAGEIFRAFNDNEREDIWSRLQVIKGLIPSLHTLFRDVGYLEHCVNCVKRLTTLSPGQSLSNAMKGRFTGANQRHGRVKVQVTEGKFVYRQGTPEDQVDFGYRQIYAFAMRHWPDMPKEPEIEDPQMKVPTKADEATLRHFADLAAELGFHSDQIIDLQQHSGRGDALAEHYQSNPILVTSGKGVHVKKRCGKQSTREFIEGRDCLFINHLHDEQKVQGSGITSFFVRKSVYLAFFGRPLATESSTSTDEMSQDSPPQSPGGSPQGSGIDVSTHSPVDHVSQSHQSSEPSVENYDGILALYQQEDARSEQRAYPNIAGEGAEEPGEGSMDGDSTYDFLEEEGELEQERREQEGREQERLELRRIEERLEREDLQRRLAQGLQAQETAEQEKQREQQLKRQEQERHDEEQRRQETRQRQRREEEVRVQGRTLKDFERTKKRNTQLDMQSIATSRKLVVADQSHTPGHLRSPATDQSGGQHDRLEQVRLEQERCEQERLEEERLEEEGCEQERFEDEGREKERREQERRGKERREQERVEQERIEQERVELRRIKETLEREDLQERLAEVLQAQRNLEQMKKRQQELEKQEQERQGEAGRRQQIREQSRREQEKRVKDDSERTRKRRTQIDMESVLANASENQKGFSAQTDYYQQLGRELGAIEPGSNTAGDSQAGGRQERQERLKAERLKEERLKEERLKGERLKGERLKEARLKEERLKEETLKEERLKEERLKEERLKEERLKEERLKEEGLKEERLKEERLKEERLKEEGLKEERLKEERLEREKRNQEKREQERLQRKTPQERFARKLQQQEISKRVKDQQEQERQEFDKREAVRQRQERRDQRRWEHEKTIESERDLQPAESHRSSPAETTRPRRRQVPNPLAQTPDSVWITFKVRERGTWRTTQSLHVHSSDPSEVERVAVKYMRKQIRVYDTDLNILTPQICFQAAIANGTNMLLLIPEREIDINEELEAYVSRLLSESDLQIDTDIE